MPPINTTRITDEDKWLFLESPHKSAQWVQEQVTRTAKVLSSFVCQGEMAGTIRRYNGKSDDYTIHGATSGSFSIRVKHSRKCFRFYIKKGRGKWRFSYSLKRHPGSHRMRASSDGRHLVVLADQGGNESYDISVIDLVSRKQLPLVLSPVRYGELKWLDDNSGFVYAPQDEGLLAIVRIWSQEQFSIDLPETMRGVLTLGCVDNKVIITGRTATRAAILDLDQISTTSAVAKVKFDYPPFDSRGRVRFLGPLEQSLIFLESFDTCYKVLSVTLDEATKTWETDILVNGVGIAEEAWLLDERTCVHLYDDRGSTIVIYDKKGKELSNFLASESGDVYHASADSPDEISIRCSTLTQSSYKLKVNFKTNSHQLVYTSNDYSPNFLITAKAYVPASSTTDIPITFARGFHHRNLKAPTILEVYGGYGYSTIPSFAPATATWLERGGTAVIAHIRGGGERGNDWYKQAAGNNKQNSVEDIIRVAEWLIENGYCTANQLGLRGVSHGGFVVAAAIAQRPDLFGAAIIESGPLDLMRRALFMESSNWGHPSALKANEAKYARALSPYHNLRRGVRYPPCIVIARQNDSRVSAVHAFKFVAALQAITRNCDDYLLLYEPSSGHYASANPDRGVAETAQWLSFAAHHLGILCYRCKA